MNYFAPILEPLKAVNEDWYIHHLMRVANRENINEYLTMAAHLHEKYRNAECKYRIDGGYLAIAIPSYFHKNPAKNGTVDISTNMSTLLNMISYHIINQKLPLINSLMAMGIKKEYVSILVDDLIDQELAYCHLSLFDNAAIPQFSVGNQETTFGVSNGMVYNHVAGPLHTMIKHETTLPWFKSCDNKNSLFGKIFNYFLETYKFHYFPTAVLALKYIEILLNNNYHHKKFAFHPDLIKQFNNDKMLG